MSGGEWVALSEVETDVLGGHLGVDLPAVLEPDEPEVVWLATALAVGFGGATDDFDAVGALIGVVLVGSDSIVSVGVGPPFERVGGDAPVLEVGAALEFGDGAAPRAVIGDGDHVSRSCRTAIGASDSSEGI